MKSISLYIHIPFCKSKCFYCDFISYPNREEYFLAYIDALIQEIKQYGKMLKEYKIETIFIGGGTPTVLPYYLMIQLFDELHKNFNIVKNVEITIESNPGTLNKEKINVIKRLGINRVSMGLQSSSNAMLKKIGRIHTYEEFLSNYYQLRQAEINNINIDLIFGLPEQTLVGWENTLNNVISLQPEHLSCYSLTVEENTKFFTLYKQDKLNLPDEDDERKMYYNTVNMLQQEGFKHYEISNFAKKGFQCRHNIVCWNCKEYVGVGVAAHSYFNKQRYQNPKELDQYIGQSYDIEKLKINVQKIDEKMACEEYMFLGLRLTEGISKQDFLKKFNKNIHKVYGHTIKALTSKGLIEENNKNIKLTQKGLDVANIVFSQFLINN